MPFFITWDVPPELHPGRDRAGHGVRAGSIAWVEIGGDADRLEEWLGGDVVPIRVAGDAPGIGRVAVATSDGELVIEWTRGAEGGGPLVRPSAARRQSSGWK